MAAMHWQRTIRVYHQPPVQSYMYRGDPINDRLMIVYRYGTGLNKLCLIDWISPPTPNHLSFVKRILWSICQY